MQKLGVKGTDVYNVHEKCQKIRQLMVSGGKQVPGCVIEKMEQNVNGSTGWWARGFTAPFLQLSSSSKRFIIKYWGEGYLYYF